MSPRPGAEPVGNESSPCYRFRAAAMRGPTGLEAAANRWNLTLNPVFWSYLRPQTGNGARMVVNCN